MKIGDMGYNINAYRSKEADNNRKTEQTIDDSSFDIRVGEAKESENEKKEVKESTTDTDIIVKADGSRVLVVTTSIAGMTTSRSLKISEPTKMPNENREANEMEEKNQDVGSGNKGAGDFTVGSEWDDTHAV